MSPLIQAPGLVFATLCGVTALFFFLEARTQAKIFQYFPPLLWIYAVPVILSNGGVLPAQSEAYDALSRYALPAFLVLMLLSVDIGAAFRVMGRGMWVMLGGSVGIVLGAGVAFALVKDSLSPMAWKTYGALSGAWIGGTANMVAVAGGLGLAPDDLGVAILADNVVYIIWLPLLLSSRAMADRFAKWAKVPPDRVQRMEAAAMEPEAERPMAMQHVLYLVTVVATVAALANLIAPRLPEVAPVLTEATWRTLLITTLSIGASLTPLRRIPGARAAGLSLVYLFLAGMGARASLAGLAEAPLFLASCLIWIAVHGVICLAVARLLRVDLHSAAIASAANIGGVVSAPVVAAHHRPVLVPAAILMGLAGYAVGNYFAVLTAQLCYWISMI